MSSPNLHPMLNVAVKAARAAGALINRAALDVESVRISQKQVNDFVTEVDHAAEQAIIETLLTNYPGHGILAEESGNEHGAKDSEYVWIIDPLDGTTNFIHGFPFYCVSIALAVKGKIEQAVVYDPSRNDLFTATKGRGAYMNDRRIRVSKRTRLNECLVSTGFPFRPGDNFKQYLAMMSDLMPRLAGLRRPGAAALDLAYVAAGFTDAFFESGLHSWDVAAGSLLVTEAGGLIGNFTGESDFLDQRECLAGAPRIYGQLVPLIAKYSKFAGVDDKLRASDRVRAVASSARAESDPSADTATDLYARTTSSDVLDTPVDEVADAAPARPAPRKLTRIRRDLPDAGPSLSPILPSGRDTDRR
ncbi:MAG: inositol monophosphatase family protein [Janthinobacterium lividum]